jgi:molecular chaperone GrpE (heat shock protein)
MTDSAKPQFPQLLKLPKWPFLVGDLLMVGVAAWIIFQTRAPLTLNELLLCVGATGLGAALGVLPFILEYRALTKLLEADRIAGAVEQIQKIDSLAVQITGSTSHWSELQRDAKQTADAAKTISKQMSVEVANFTEFLQKANDSEKRELRLEVEKLRRAEGEWLKILVNILDHTFALHQGAVHSGQKKVSEQIGQFQGACLDIARRVGLAAFVAMPDESFDAKRHQLADEQIPPADARIAGTLAAGYTFRGELLRPAVVALQTNETSAKTEAEPAEKLAEQSLL